MSTARPFEELRAQMAAEDPEFEAGVRKERLIAIGEIVEYTLGELRRAREITQAELARALGTGQPNVSRIENATDVEIQTLRKYVEALGGRLEISAVFDNDEVTLAV